MTIELDIETMIKTLRKNSHDEVQVIQDVEARDNARAGLDKIDEIRQCVKDGIAQVSRRCWRWLADDRINYAGNTDDMPQTVAFELRLSERRGTNKAEPLTAAMQSLVIEYAMSKFYAIVSQQELSNKHSLAAVEAGNTIDELLFTKKPPRA